MELIKKRAEKALQHKKSKFISKALTQLTNSTSNTQQIPSLEKSASSNKIISCHQNIMNPHISSQQFTPTSNNFSIKNLDQNYYQALSQSQFQRTQQNLNKQFQTFQINTNLFIQDQVWNTYKTQLEKAEAEFFQACSLGKINRINQILSGKSQYPIKPNCIQEDGRNCLHIVINGCQDQDIFRRLIYAGGNVNQKTQMGRTPLMIASIKGLIKIVKILIQFKCQINDQDTYGNSALHYACIYNHYQIAQLLLINNINFNLINNEGQNAYECCSNTKLYELFQNSMMNRSVSSDYSRTVYDEIILKNSRVDHVNKLLDKISNKSYGRVSLQDKNQIQKQLQTNNRLSLSQISKKKNRFNRYQVLAQVIIKDIKQVSLLDFKQVNILGKGAFGSVLLVQHQTDKKLYAMKILNKTQILQQKLLRYAMTQRKILSIINHPFVVKLHYAFQTPQKLILIMDYCPGGDLLELVRKKKSLQQNIVKKYCAQIILALECLHKAQIIYRDLKPANIVIDQQGHACLTDFGLAKQADVSHSFCGSLAYLSPEMLSRRGHTRTLDWYLLGVVIYECLTGRPPFWDTNKQSLIQNIKIGRYKQLPSSASNQVKDLVSKLLKSNPSKRLGCQSDAEQIKKHEWFKDINWSMVQQRKQVMPIPNNLRDESNLRMDIFNQKQIQLGKNVNNIKQWQYK